MDIAQPHDRFFKLLLSDPDRVGTLLRERLPVEVARSLAPEPPEWVAGSFVDEALRSHLTDRLFSAWTVGKRRMFLYVLIEHKSQPERRIAWQLAKYQMEVLKQWEREHRDWDKLPAVVPFVFYHGATEWRIPNEFLALVDAEEAWKPYLMNFHFPLFDLGQVADHELSRQPRLHAWLLVAKYGTREFVRFQLQQRFIDALATVPEDLPVFIRYMIECYEHMDDQDLRTLIRGVLPQEEHNMMSKFARDLIANPKPEWVQMVRQDGWQDGWQDGQQEGEAALLLRLLQRRFGSLPEWVVGRVRSADQTLLERWGDQIFDATTLEDLFSDHEKP
ncbi:MAG: Rpn family recombination-promoting nuclease/putative transposase [Magnetococcales bacterium]|nr:Rpn family recombination-promoting nuclease/putative transposase [Magnetococcales bacterium]